MTDAEKPVDLLQGAKHCDDYIMDSAQPMCLRWYLYINRIPAIDKMLCLQNGVKEPTLFAHYKDGTRVRVVMASRFGDVGITKNLKADHGYELRVTLAELSNFSDQHGFKSKKRIKSR